MTMKEYMHSLKVGDEVTRLLAGSVVMKLIVGGIDEDVVKCGNEDVPWEDGWTFLKENGAERDMQIGWDGFKVTGSVILPPGVEIPSRIDPISMARVASTKAAFIAAETRSN